MKIICGVRTCVSMQTSLLRFHAEDLFAPCGIEKYVNEARRLADMTELPLGCQVDLTMLPARRPIWCALAVSVTVRRGRPCRRLGGVRACRRGRTRGADRRCPDRRPGWSRAASRRR